MADEVKTTEGSAAQIEETRVPSQPVTLEMLMNPMGNSGVFLVNGFLEQDYNAKLAGKVGIDTYDKMRKSDATVSALLEVVGLPIRSTDWFIEAGKDPEGEVGPDEEEIGDFVHRALFEKLEQGWDDHLREVLTCLWAGFSVKEKVYTNDEDHIWLKKLAFRKQRTVYRWAQSDGSAGITQITPTPSINIKGQLSNILDIPASKLLVFTFQQEGNNYEGTSLLRPAYKHYYIKDQLYKFDSVRHERQSIGVPMITLPKGCSTDDYNRAKTILKNFRAHEMTGLVMPDSGWVFSFADLKAGDVSDLWKSIDHHNREILKTGLAQFLELGGASKGSSGSKAVSADQSAMFLLAIDSVAKMIEEVHNRFLIPELVDMNFDNVYRYPRLQHKRLEKIDMPALAIVIQNLIASGALTTDPEFEEWTRKTFDLPPKIQENVEPTDDEPQDQFPQEEIPKDDEEVQPIGTGDVLPGQLPNQQQPDNQAASPEVPQEQTQQQPDANPEEQPNADNTAELTPEEVQAEIDKLDASPSKKAKFYDIGGSVFAEIEDEFYTTDGLTFAGPVSDETKAKISAALKAYHAANGTSAQAAALKAGRVVNVTQQVAQRKAARTAQNATKAVPKAAAPVATGTPSNVGTQGVRNQQEKKDPNAPMNKTAAAIAPAVTQKAPSAASSSKGGSKASKSADKAAKAQAKADAKALKTELNPKGNARQKLDSLRQSAQNAKTPEEKAAVRAALVKLQLSLATKTSNQATKQNNKGVKAAAKAAKAAAKQKKGKGGGKGKKGKKGGTPASPQQVARTLAKLNPLPMTEGGARSRKGDDNEALQNPIHEDDAPAVDLQIEAHEMMHWSMQIFADLYDGNMILAAQRCVDSKHFTETPSVKRRKFADTQKSWRPLTFAEGKVNLDALRKAISTAGASLQVKLDDITKNQKADLLSQVKRAVDANDIAAVGKIKAKYTGDISSALVDVQKQMFEQGMRSATSEMNVSLPPTAAEVKGVMRVQSDKLTQKLSNDMEAAATKAVTQVTIKNNGKLSNVTTQEAIAAASDAIDNVTQQVAAMHTLSIIGSLNLGRSAIFERYPEQVYAFQYSAVIDDKTTDLCLSLDGRIVDAGSDDYDEFTPPQHYNCRSIWVEILQNEEFKPEIDGIPSSIQPNATIDEAQGLEAPILKQNSPALKVLQEELDDRKSKVDQYTAAGTYQNRIDSHTSRIADLEQAIADATDSSDDGE